MTQETGKSYVMNEAVAHSEKQGEYENRNHREILQSFQHNISHLDKMIQKINTLEKGSIKNTDTINILNTLLQKKHIGGINGWAENKAYFKKHGDTIVLVLNTVVNGKKVDTMGDIDGILTKVDRLLIENTVAGKIENSFKRLAQYERQMLEINTSYRENTNDWFMLRDSFVDAVSGESGRKIYTDNFQSIQRNIAQEREKLLASLPSEELTLEDKRKLAFYQRQTEDLLGRRLEDVQSFTGYLTKEKKLDSAKNALYAIKGIGEWAFEAITGTAVFLFLFATKPEIRDAVYWSIGSFYDYLKENYSDYDKLWGDFCTTLDKEFKKFEWLPDNQKAEAIGKITGNVMATILGAKGMSAAIKSGKLRLKFKTPEELSTAKAPKTFKATEVPRNNANSVSKKWKKRKNNPTETDMPKKNIANIDEVKNWADLESFVNTIDRVRFKEWLTGKVLQEMIDEVKQGTRNIKDIPDYGGIRDVVDNLKRFGGVMPEVKGVRKIAQMTGEKIGKRIGNVQDMLPFKETQKLLHKKMLTGYDHVDIHITKLRTLINDNMVFSITGLAKIAHLEEIKNTATQVIENMKTISFPWKEKFLKSLEGLKKSLEETIDDISNGTESLNKQYLTKEWNLTKKEFNALRFEEGFAIREIERDGKILYEYRDVKGKKAFEEYIYASHFKDGEAAVTKIVDGKEVNLTINREWKIIFEHSESSFTSIQRFGNGGYRIFDGESYRIKYPESNRLKSQSCYYVFMTEIRGNMVIGVDKKNGVKYIINQDGKRFKTPFHYIDDFTEDGVAAVRESPNGNWLLIDKEGNLLKKDGSILRKNEDIITKNKNGKYIDAKWNLRTIEEGLKQEEEFKTMGFDRNLEAIKTRAELIKEKEIQKVDNPELTKKKRELDSIALSKILKKNNIHPTGPLIFKNTEKNGILLYSNPVTKGIQVVNLETGTLSRESFSSIHTPDINNGFIRVSPLKDKENMWVIDLNGEYIVPPKYIDIQILDEKKKLFEVSEMRKIGEKLKDGTIIEEHFSDNLKKWEEMVKRTGLINEKGKIVIETWYTEITLLDEKTAQGFIRWEKHEILKRSKRYDTHKAATDVASSTNQTMTTLAILVAEGPMVSEKAGRWSLNIIRSETSMVLSEIKNNELSLLINGTQKINKNSSPQIQNFMNNKVPTIRDIWKLEEEIGKIIQNGVDESVKKYLEKNKLHKLTKPERVAVANYEKEIRESLMQLIRTQVQNEQIIFRNRKLNGREGFMDNLVNNLHPDLYKSLGGKIEIFKEMRKAA